MTTKNTNTTETPNPVGFVNQYWAWKLRRRTTEPQADEFGLSPVLSEALARQVHQEFEKQVVSQANQEATKV